MSDSVRATDISQESVGHLINVVSQCKNNGHSRPLKIIESHVMKEYVAASCKKESELEIFNKSSILKVCRWCLVTWSDSSMYRVCIEPEKKKGKLIRSLLNKKTENLNKFQKKLVKKCQKNLGLNYLVVMCNFCQKETKLPLKKPLKPCEEHPEELEISVKVKKKRKKKSDKCAGLNPNVVSQYIASNKLAIQKELSEPPVNNVNNKNHSSFEVPKNKTSGSSALKTRIKRLMNENKNKSTVPKQKPQKKSLLASFLDSL